jgi:hypothetical protein
MKQMMRREYRVNADCMQDVITDMEDILGIRQDISNTRGISIGDRDYRRQNYLNMLIMRMRTFLEMFGDEDDVGDGQGIFDIMDGLRRTSNDTRANI